jgi:hypothetical protein
VVPLLPLLTAFVYQHTPPRYMAVHKRWRSCFEAQAKPATSSATIEDIWI